MKFLQPIPLQKHMEASAASGAVPAVYLVLHAQREERRRFLEKIAETLALLTKAEIRSIDGEWKDVYPLVATPSLFGEKEIILWSEGKELLEETLLKMKRYVASPSPSSYLLIGAEPSKELAKFYSECQKSIVLLDLSEEKPWDKEKRLEQELLLAVKNASKSVSKEAATLLLESVGGVSTALDSELAKLFLYVGDRAAIEVDDIKKICAPSSATTGWQMAEELLWEGKLPPQEKDLSFLLAFLGQLRFLLQQARTVGFCLRQKKSQEEIAKQVNLRAPQLQKITQRLQRSSLTYLEKALELIFEVELLSKNSSHAPHVLLELLQIKLNFLRKSHARR